MKVVVQRVSKTSVAIEGEIKSSMGMGLLVLAGFEDSDNDEDLKWMSAKLTNLRIFSDENGLMNRSVKETDGDVIVVSQFTLHAMTKKGNRPSFIRAAKPDVAVPLYEKFVLLMSQELGKPVGTGEFGAHMEVSLINDGPVTIIIDSKNKD